MYFKQKLIDHPFLLLLFTGILVLILGFFSKGNIDFHFSDTYFVMSAEVIIWALGLIFCLIWGIYKLTHKFLWTRILTWAHVSITLVIFLLLATIGVWHNVVFLPTKTDFASIQEVLAFEEKERMVLLLVVIIFIIGQLAYFVNLIGGLFKFNFQRLGR